MRLSQVIGSFIIGTTAVLSQAQNSFADNKPEPPKPSNPWAPIYAAKEEALNLLTSIPEAYFQALRFARMQKLIEDFDSPSFKVRAKASNDLFPLSKDVTRLTYILDEWKKPLTAEVRRRLDLAQKKALTSLEETASTSKNPEERIKIGLDLIGIMGKRKKEDHIWKKLAPRVDSIIKSNPVPSEGYYYDDVTNIFVTLPQADPKLLKPLSKVLLSAYDKGSPELQNEVTEIIISLAKEPLYEINPFILFYTHRLERLSELPLKETEAELRKLKHLYSRLTSTTQRAEEQLASSVKPHLEKILERNIEAFCTNDPEKEQVATANINALKEQPSFLQVKDLITSKHIPLIFSKRKEFSKNITNTSELRTSIEDISSTSQLLGIGSDYYIGYLNWLERQIDNPILQKISNKKETQDIIENALVEILLECKERGIKAETVNSLIKTYTKLALQSAPDKEFIRKNIQTIIDFHCLTYRRDLQKTVHDDLLVLFDTIANKVNDLPNPEEKSSLRMEILSAVQRPDSFVKNGCKDYAERLSNFYCKKSDLAEFIRLTKSLLDSREPDHVGKSLPPGIMLEFIESNPKYFERMIQQMIETYNKSNELTVKSRLKEQLREIYLSFHNLFNIKNKAEKNVDGWLSQDIPKIRLGNMAEWSSTNLKYRTDWRNQIERIERWFRPSLERQMVEIIYQKSS